MFSDYKSGLGGIQVKFACLGVEMLNMHRGSGEVSDVALLRVGSRAISPRTRPDEQSGGKGTAFNLSGLFFYNAS